MCNTFLLLPCFSLQLAGDTECSFFQSFGRSGYCLSKSSKLLMLCNLQRGEIFVTRIRRSNGWAVYICRVTNPNYSHQQKHPVLKLAALCFFNISNFFLRNCKYTRNVRFSNNYCQKTFEEVPDTQD